MTQPPGLNLNLNLDLILTSKPGLNPAADPWSCEDHPKCSHFPSEMSILVRNIQPEHTHTEYAGDKYTMSLHLVRHGENNQGFNHHRFFLKLNQPSQLLAWLLSESAFDPNSEDG